MPKADPEKLVKVIITRILGEEKKVSLKRTEIGDLVKLEIEVPAEDIGKIIGRSGRTLWAIRRWAGVAGANLAKKVLITLVE